MTSRPVPSTTSRLSGLRRASHWRRRRRGGAATAAATDTGPLTSRPASNARSASPRIVARSVSPQPSALVRTSRARAPPPRPRAPPRRQRLHLARARPDGGAPREARQHRRHRRAAGGTAGAAAWLQTDGPSTSLARAGSTTRLSPMPHAVAAREALQADVRERRAVAVRTPAPASPAAARRASTYAFSAAISGAENACVGSATTSTRQPRGGAVGRRGRPRGSRRRRAAAPRRTCRSRRPASDSMSGSPCPVREADALGGSSLVTVSSADRKAASPRQACSVGAGLALGVQLRLDQILPGHDLRSRCPT